jgi:hypothetical protein
VAAGPNGNAASCVSGKLEAATFSANAAALLSALMPVRSISPECAALPAK